MARLKFRYSLRTFLLLVVVASIPLGWLAKTMDRVRRQRAAIAQVVAAGGEVRYDYQLTPVGQSKQSPPGSWLLRRLIGDDVFAEVSYVGWHGSSGKLPTDNDVRLLSQLPDLEWVILHGSKVTDASLPHLARLPRLESLMLDATALTREGLAGLSSCRRLTSLSLSDVTDEKLKGVGDLTQLEHLNIVSSSLTDSGLRALETLSSLEHIQLLRTPSVTGDGLQFLPQPENIRSLGIAEVPMTDAALEHVAGMRELKHLMLLATQISDAGLQKPFELPELTEVQLWDADVGDAGVASILQPGLVRLEIQGTKATDAIVSRIAEARRLELLNISFTKITDASIQELSKCKSLVHLNLGPGVSVEAAKKLKASLPDCHIDLYGANSHQEIKLP